MLTTQNGPLIFLVVLSLSALVSSRHFAESVALRMSINGSHLIAFLCGVLALPLVKRLFGRVIRTSSSSESSTVYGLEHGRLHLEPSTPMWMNMGYWAHEEGNEVKELNDGEDVQSQNQPGSKAMAEACRDLLVEVLKTAGFSRKRESSELLNGAKTSKCLIDLGFGCGDQTIYLASDVPLGKSDKAWWDSRDLCPRFDQYVGITLDEKQYCLASEGMRKLTINNKAKGHHEIGSRKSSEAKLFCADAATPRSWREEVREGVQYAINNTEEHWILALDTAYHFSPSRWSLVKHACHDLRASFMAFDLCLSPTASNMQKVLLRIFTKLMGAPWANFGTVDEYRSKLVEAGYEDSQITIRDISHDVFGPLATFIEEQDCRLRVLGLSVGPFNVARLMFRWWANSGIVRGIIVVAKISEKAKS